MDKITKYFIMFMIAMVAFSIFYYLVIFLPSEKKALREQQAQAEIEKRNKEAQAIAAKQENEIAAKQALLSCLGNAIKIYTSEWNSECKRLGKFDECQLPSILADRLNHNTDKNKEECYRLFPIMK